MLRIRRIGSVLHVLAWGHPGILQYVRLTPELQVATAPQTLGEPEGEGPGPVVGDARWTLILFEGVPASATKPDGRGYYAVSFDAAGARIAERMLAARTAFPRANDRAVVSGGYAFVPTRSDDVVFARLGPTLRVEEAAFDGTSDPGHPVDLRAMFRWQDRAYVDWRSPSSWFGPRGIDAVQCRTLDSASDADVDLWLSDEHVTLRGDNAEDWIEWTDAAKAAPPPPPCRGIHRAD
jgi:hypothetical protein